MEATQPAPSYSPATRFTKLSKKSILLGILILAALFLVSYIAAKSVFSPTRTVTTTGIGRQTVPAAKARIVFSFSDTSDDRTFAKIEGEEEFNQILTAINQFSPEEVVKTPESVQPVATRDANNQVTLAGYQYSIGARVTVSGPEQIADLISFLNESRASIANISYLPEDQSAVGAQARSQALEDARTKAVQIAKASGSRVGRVITVAEQGSNNESGSTLTSAQTGAESYTAGSFNQIEIQSLLTVQFELW